LTQASTNTKRLVPLVAVLLGLVVYWWLFLDVRMPSVEDAQARTGQREGTQEENVFRRGAVFGFLGRPEGFLELWAGRPPEFSLLDRVPLAAVVGGIIGWAAALGWLLLVLLGADRGLTRLENLVFSTAVGLNAISTFALAAGLCGWLRWGIVFLVPAAITVATAAWLWRRKRGLQGSGFRVQGSGPATRHRPPLTTSPPHPLTPSPRHPVTPPPATRRPPLSPHWLWLAAPFVAMIVLGGMLPPADFDVREYHLQAPKEFYQQGRITFLPHNVYANMPLGAEMFCLVGMAVTGDWWLGALAGKTVIASMTLLAALGLWAAGRRFFSPAAGTVAAVVYLSVPWIVQVSTAGLVDAAVGCYLLLAVYAMLLATVGNAQQVQSTANPLPTYHLPPTTYHSGHVKTPPNPLSIAVLAGYLAGGAVSCKYPAVAFVVLPLLVWAVTAALLSAVSPQTPRRGLAALGAGCARVGALTLAVAIGCGLWFGKNWALTGNPTYPLLYSVFGGETWDLAKDRQWMAVHGPRDVSWDALGSDLVRVTMTSEWLSPLVMPLAALALLGRRKATAWVLAAYFAMVIAVWWLFTHRIDRFWIPALPLAALLAGAGACWSAERLWRWGLLAFLVVGTTYGFLAAGSVGGGYSRYFIGLDRARRDPNRVPPWHLYLNRHVRQGRVLLVGDAAPFDLEMPVLYNTCFDDSIFEQLVSRTPEELRSPEELRAAFADRGITYVLVHWAEIRRYRRTYGYTPFVGSGVFYRLVDEAVLELDSSWPPDKEIQGVDSRWRSPEIVAEGYRVLPPDAGNASTRD
jgi:hypothetical protein